MSVLPEKQCCVRIFPAEDVFGEQRLGRTSTSCGLMKTNVKVNQASVPVDPIKTFFFFTIVNLCSTDSFLLHTVVHEILQRY